MAVCKPPCPLKDYGSMVQSNGTFMIKTYGGDHTCPRAMTNKLISSKWIAKRYVNVFRVRYHLSAKDLKEDILQRFKSHVPKDRLYKGRRLARELARGSVDAHYASITSYIAELRRVDKEGRFEPLLGNNAVFKGFYMGLSALRKGFKASCRPLIGLDGCFLKTFLGGILLCATGNNGMFPIAWAVVEIENEDCWTWFLKCLLEDLQIADGNGWAFISDQQKGLQNAVANLAPQAEHRNCARHVYMNWKKQHKGATQKNLFWRAVKCTYVEDLKMAIQAMKTENAAACEDFLARDINKLCKAFLSTSCCSDMVDNNISETFNGFILNARGKHVIHMCEEIRTSLMVRQVQKFKQMTSVTGRLCPNIRLMLEKLNIESVRCIPYPALGDSFEVHDEADKFVVNMLQRTCSCRVWDLVGIPYVQVISAITFLNRDASDYVNDYYTVSKYLAGYEFGIQPIRGNKMWPEVGGVIVKPPLVRKMPGRPKKKRSRAPEEKEPGKALSRHGSQMTCSKCHKKGHNTRGCKNEQVQKPITEKRKRGRPAKTNFGVSIQERTENRGRGNMFIQSVPSANKQTTTRVGASFTRGRGRGSFSRPRVVGSSSAVMTQVPTTQESINDNNRNVS